MTWLCSQANIRPNLGRECLDPEACAGGYPCDKVRMEYMDTDKIDSETEDLRQQLRDWWLVATEREIAKTVPKAIEYSSIDLIEYGRTLAVTILGRSVSEEEAVEIGIWGYLVGKVARWTGAIKDGRRPSDDTLLDISVYTKMAQRNREVGGWPVGPEGKVEWHG